MSLNMLAVNPPFRQEVVKRLPRNRIRQRDHRHGRIDARGLAELHTERHGRHGDQRSGDQIASARFEYVHLTSLDDLSLVAPRRGAEEAGPQILRDEDSSRRFQILAEQGSPAVARGEPNRGVGGFPSRSGKGDSGAVKRRSTVRFVVFPSGPAEAGVSTPRYCSANQVRRDATAAVAETPNQLQAWKHLRCRHRALAVGARAFFLLAAKRLSVTQFVFLTQVALVMSIPLLITHQKSRSDLVSLLGNATNYYKFGALFLIGMAGLLLFKLGLSNAHPIIISAIINLQPFFAALVALLVARVPIPVSPPSSSVASLARFSARWRSPGARSARATGRS